LKEEICSVIAIHRPQDMDIFCALALMQEEVAESGKRKQAPRSEHFAPKPNWKYTQPAEKGKITRNQKIQVKKGMIS
jgi:hypothetical protein